MGLMPHHLDVLAHVAGGDIGVGIFRHARPVVLVPDEFQSPLVTEVSSQVLRSRRERLDTYTRSTPPNLDTRPTGQGDHVQGSRDLHGMGSRD